MKERYELTKEKYLLDEEQNLLINTLNKFKDIYFRDTTLCGLRSIQVVRASELLNLKTTDICRYSQTISIKGIKGSNNRDIPLPPWLFKRIDELAGFSKTGDLFPI